MNNPTPASLLKKITLKRAALAEAKAAHAVALAESRAASHDLATSDPVDNYFSKSRSHSADVAVYKAYRLVDRRAYALATLGDALDSARRTAAAARRAADAALHDAGMDATAEDRAAYARAVQADDEAAEALAAATADSRALAAASRAALAVAAGDTPAAEAPAAAAPKPLAAAPEAPKPAAEAPKPLAATPEEVSAGFMRAADRVFADMAANCARLEAERAKREAALAAAETPPPPPAPLAGTGSAAQAAANAAWNEAAAREAAALRPTADGEAVDAVASLATLPASLVEAARAYLAAVAADCGVADAARHFGAEKDAVAFENTGDAAAEARALISAANYNAACRAIDARRAARNA